MTPKQQRFAEEYVIDYNGTQAAIRAGYSPKTAGAQAHDLLKKPEIRQHVQKLSDAAAEELGITKRRILTRLWEVVEKAYEGSPKTDKDGLTVTAYIDGEEQVIYEWSPSGTTKALELLMKHMGMLTERVEHTGGVDIRINGVSIDDLT